MASQFPPKKNTAFTLYFSLYKSDGTIIANPGTFTKKISIDGGSVADISNTITEEDTTYGQCSVVLTASEMNGDAIWVFIKDDTSGCVPFTATIYTAANTQDGIESKIDTVDGIVDSILADTGTDGVVVAAASKTGYALSAAGIQAIWDALSSALTTAGSIGKRLVDYLTGDIFGRLGAPAGASVSADIAAVKSDTAAILVDTGTSGVIVATNNDKSGYSLASEPPTAAAIADAVWDETSAGHTEAGKAGAQLWTDIDAILVDTDVIGTAGAGLSSIPWNAAWDAEVQSECADALAAYDPPTKAEMDTGLDALPTAAEIKTALEAAGSHLDLILEDTGTTLNGKIDTIDNIVDAIVADTNELQTDWADGGRLDLLLDGASAPSATEVADAVWDEVLTGHTDTGSAGLALSTASTGGVDTSALADAVWDEDLSGHVGSGSAGAKLATAADGGTDPWSVSLPGTYGAGTAGKIVGDNINAPIATVNTVVDAIKVKTDQLVFTVANRVDSTATVVDKTGYSLTSAYDAAKVAASQSSLDALDTIVDAIKVKTDLIPDSPAAVGDIPTVDDIWDEPSADHTQAGSMAVLLGSVTAGAGSVEEVITITDGTNPLDGVSVWVSTDSAGANVVAGPLYTNTSGQATFMLDPGTYYVWKQLSGYNFTNPESMVVS